MKALFPGSVFAGYRIEDVIGRGGMGVIYRAMEARPERVVAVKVVAPELATDVGFRARFLRESQIAASIEHPHVVPVLRVGEEDELLYIVMRFIRGQNLAQIVHAEAPLEPARAAQIVDQVADALDTAHEQGLVHRDVKPANVLVERRRRGDHVYLTDFGLTKHMATSASLTGTGMAVGTTDYMAPEQWEGRAVDRRVDIYSLGCVLFEMLTGRVPFRQEGQAARMYAHLTLLPPKVTELVPELPTEFDGVIGRALAKRPDERYASAGDLAAAALDAVKAARTAAGFSAAGTQAVTQPEPAPAATAVRSLTVPAPDRPRAAPARRQRAPHPPGRSRSTAMVVAIVVLALAIAGAAAAVVVTRGSGGSTTASEQANAAAPRGSSSGKASPKLLTGSGGQPAGGLPTETYSGQSFSISYPKGWQIQSAEQEKGGYFDTTFVSGADPNMLLRVDYTPNDATDPMQAAQTVVNAVQRQPGYQQLDLSRGTFNGFPAAHWEFTVPEGGITLHKEDEFFTDTANNASVAVLTQAPQSQYSGLANQLARLRRSLTMK